MRLRDVAKQCEPNKQVLASNLINEITFMKGELADLRADIRENGATEFYVNGKQQLERIRPAMQVYTTLVARYSTLTKQLLAIIPKEVADQGDEFDEFLRELRG